MTTSAIVPANTSMPLLHLPLLLPPVPACLGEALLCGLILWALLRSGLAWWLATDVPNHRSMHVRPTPRVGGWGLVPAALLLLLTGAPSRWRLAAGAGVLAEMSHLDDRYELSAKARFLVHFAAVAGLLLCYPLHFAAGPATLTVVTALLALVWLINLYNFTDGIDGLAGGMTLVGFGTYACAAIGREQQLAWAEPAVAGAAAGFLCFNFHPARLFLGDAGSIPLGFLAGALGYWGWRNALWPCWFPRAVFAPFVADATVTLLRRASCGEKIWQAHREHYFQRTVQRGVQGMPRPRSPGTV
jgi:UDP-N-acetylmuramyl pentapeptide phosphotransferase/UDP-N-acetylglucosamine-1-phosphate transferase